MKINILLIAFIMTTPCMAWAAASMCVKPGALTMMLDPRVNGNGSYSGKTWRVSFPYGQISGIAGCYNTNSNWQSPEVQSSITTSTTGEYCYCKMLHPLESKWIFISQKSQSLCTTYAGFYCAIEAIGASNTISHRQTLFNNIELP